MKFMIGCNYWASHAGTDMWIRWDEKTVDEDLRRLSEYGVRYMRVFPIWRDFQPVVPYYGGSMSLHEYRMENGSLPTNPYYIDEVMMDRFATLCKLAQKHGIKLIVGIVTGWMSGRLFVPAALNNLNLFTDPRATMLTLKFVHGFVKMMKAQPAIYAWDLGNECNCMASVPSRESAYTWSAMVSDAIRAEDSTRRIVSGMHGLRINNEWTIADQGELTDILTTHPYPYWVTHARVDKTISARTLLHSAAETELYSALGKKPALVEEVGTMGPQVCSEELAATFMRCQLFSAWANGHLGMLWWCAFDQNELSAPPYAWNMVERYLGLFEVGYKPKPALKEMKRISELFENLAITLPEKKKDAVCILTRDIDHWGIAYMTYVLAKQAGLTITFADCEGDLPKSDCYLLPSVKGVEVMEKSKYDDLKQRVANGATLYISIGNGIITEFEELVGARITDSCETEKRTTVMLGNSDEQLVSYVDRELAPTTATVLLAGAEGEPVLLSNGYGKGSVYYLNYPLEESLLNQSKAFDSEKYRIYSHFANEIKENHPIVTANPFIGITYHYSDDADYAVLINYSDKHQKTEITKKTDLPYTVLYGSDEALAPAEACIIRLGK